MGQQLRKVVTHRVDRRRRRRRRRNRQSRRRRRHRRKLSRSSRTRDPLSSQAPGAPGISCADELGAQSPATSLVLVLRMAVLAGVHRAQAITGGPVRAHPMRRLAGTFAWRRRSLSRRRRRQRCGPLLRWNRPRTTSLGLRLAGLAAALAFALAAARRGRKARRRRSHLRRPEVRKEGWTWDKLTGRVLIAALF